jgi:hypothetical protein
MLLRKLLGMPMYLISMNSENHLAKVNMVWLKEAFIKAHKEMLLSKLSKRGNLISKTRNYLKEKLKFSKFANIPILLNWKTYSKIRTTYILSWNIWQVETFSLF